MTLKDISDYEYVTDKFDLTNFFSVEERLEPGGSITTFFNLNDGMSVEGADELSEGEMRKYICRSGDNLRFISYREYGSIHYWWLIAKINHIQDVLEPLEGGRQLLLLSKQHMNYIMQLLMGKKSDA